MELKKVRCKKIFGTWYYTLEKATLYNGLGCDVYTLYNEDEELENEFACYWHMKHYIETGEILA